MIIEERPVMSPLRQIPPELRLVSLVVFSLSAGQADDIREMAIAGLYGIILMALSIGSVKKVIKRALVVEAPLLLLPLTMPFSYGGSGPEVLGAVFSLEGFKLSLFIMMRVFMISLVLITVLSSEHPYRWFTTMGRLKMPHKLVTICRLSYRYIWVIFDEYKRLQNSLKVRAFKPGFDRNTYRTLSYLLGMILVRTHQRSIKVAGAVRLRAVSDQWIEFSPVQRATVPDVAWGILLIVGAGGCVLI